MKKKIVGILSLLLCLLLGVSLIACGNKHKAKEEWTWNETQHWHECSEKDHDDKLDLADHRFDEGAVTVEPTATAEGVRTFTCSDCGYKKTEPIAKPEHMHIFDAGTVTVEPTETAEGEKTYTCTICGYKKTEALARLNHTHTFDESKWSSDANKHWHAPTCGHDVKKDEGDHTFDTGTVTVEPTETADGEKTYTCTVCGYKKTETLARLDHTHTFDESKWTYDEIMHWHASACGHNVKKDEAEHTLDEGNITVKPTEKTDGEIIYTCSGCGYKQTEVLARLDHTHTFDDTVWSNNVIKHWHASTCGHNVKKDEAYHDFDKGTVTAEPTETEEGVRTFTCGTCEYKKTEAIAKLEHTHKFDDGKWSSDANKHWHPATCGHDVRKDEGTHNFDAGVITKAATETTEGEKTYTCGTCGYKMTEAIARLDHTHKYDETKWSSDANKHWHASTCGHDVKKDEASHSFDAGVVTKAATETTEGEKTYTCGTCGYKKTEAIARLDHTHKYDETKWSSDANKHWHASTCGHDVRKDEGNHKFTNWTVETPAGYGTAGTRKSACDTCGYVTKEAIPALSAKDNSVTVKSGTVLTKEYDGKTIALSPSDFTRNGNGAITIQYKIKDSADAFSAAAPKNAGTYTVKVSVAATAEWKACEATIEYTVTPKALSSLKLEKTYDGKSWTMKPVTSRFEGDSLFIRVEFSSKNVDAEIVSVKLMGDNAANYTIDVSDVEVKILKKELVFNDSVLTKVYDGTPTYTHIFTEADGLISGDECTYSFDIYNYYGTVAYINAREYTDLTIQNEFVSNGNYYVNNIGLSDPQGTSITITKKVLGNLSFLLMNSALNVGGGEQTITREVRGTDGKVRVTITFNVQDLTLTHKLDLVTDEHGQGEATIEIVTDEEGICDNYELAATGIGYLQLLGY